MSTAQALEAFAQLRRRDPALPLPALLARLVMWKFHRLTHAEPVVRLHTSSRMKLRAKPGEYGIQTAIYLFRDAYEPSVRYAIDTYVKQGDKVYDIGANLGLWSLRMLERVGSSGSVCAFEPNPETADRLKQNIDLSSQTNALICTHALGSSTDTMTLFVPDDVGRSSLAAEAETDRRINVRVRRLDDVWNEQGRPPISFVKIDVEGAEPMVFRGAAEFLRSVRPVICCEVNIGKLANMGSNPSDVTQPLIDLGYKALIWNDALAQLTPVDTPADMRETYDLVFIP